MLVVVVGEAVDFCDEVFDDFEGAATDGLLGNEPKPSFHLIEPGRISWCVVDVESGPRGSQRRTLACLWVAGIRNRMDKAYLDKLDGTIAEDFWTRKMNDWRLEEQQVKMAIDGLSNAETGDTVLNAQKIFELANQAYYLYFTMDTAERADMLRKLCSNFSVDAVSATPTYRYPFNMIFERGKTEKWSALVDDFRTLIHYNRESAWVISPVPKTGCGSLVL